MSGESAGASAVRPSAACALSWPEQRRNLAIFALCTGMQYLAAPLLYVGITQASLCKRLGADARTSNLPLTLFFAMMAMPVLVAWAWPQVTALKRNLSLCYALTGLMLAAVAGSLLTDVSNEVKLSVVILQGGVSGALISTAIALLWEVVARGTEEARRGLAMGLAFGLGPIFAVIGSFVQTWLLGGELFGLKFEGMGYPDGFVILFGLGVPILLFSALFAQFCIVPAATHEVVREPASQVVGLLVGVPAMFLSVCVIQAASFFEDDLMPALHGAGYALAGVAAVGIVHHFRGILRTRILLLITVVIILLYAGNGNIANMNLYSEKVLGNLPEKYAGVQNVLRFGFKMTTGLVLGWLLTRTNPRAGVLATSGLLLLSQIWAMVATGPLYLVAFGLFGAGELVGAYAPNYLVCASRKDELRRNMAYATLLMVPAAPASYLYASLIDLARDYKWTWADMTSEVFGFSLSFIACSVVIVAGTLIAITMLPRTPTPEAHQPDA